MHQNNLFQLKERVMMVVHADDLFCAAIEELNRIYVRKAEN